MTLMKHNKKGTSVQYKHYSQYTGKLAYTEYLSYEEDEQRRMKNKLTELKELLKKSK